MKFSTKVRYGMRALVEIATADQSELLNISQIAESQDISRKYLESLLIKLKKQGILKSIRGQRGGYKLNRAPIDINVHEIVEALHGPLCLIDCQMKGENCLREAQCTTVNLWKHLSDNLVGEMQKISLEDLINNRYESRSEF